MILILLLLVFSLKLHEVTMEFNEGAFVMFIDPGFTCNNGTRIRGRQLCDEIKDCSENEDEDSPICFPKTYPCRRGGVIEMNCPVSGKEYNSSTIKWLMNDLPPNKWPRPTHREFIDKAYQLKIKECDYENRGNYTCTVHKNGSETEKVSYTFIVEYIHPPQFITEKPQNKTVKLGDSWSFKCSLVDPSLEIHWYKGNFQTTKYTTDMQDVDYLVNEAGELYFSNVSLEDEGWYSCRVLDEESRDASASAYLNVTNRN